MSATDTNGRPMVGVVVPVYDGLDVARDCIESVLRHAPTTRVAAELVVIDDASPDPGVAAYLAELLERESAWPVRVERNAENLGFVASANLGMAMITDDVVLLNSDTVVTEGWLDRLADAAAGPDVATVTPLTNSGSLCTLPPSVIDAFDLADDEPRVDDCARFVEATSLGLRPEVISGVGFCLYVTRAALDACGDFDEDAFGRGYGEEVDFCLRASRLGFRHLVEDATYVHHRGSVSFGDDRDERVLAATKVVQRRYRWFRPANRYERRNDPLAVPFAALESALHPRDADRGHVLHVLHGPLDDLGGTEKHLHALLDALADELDASLLYPVESGFVLETRWRQPDGTTWVERHLLPGAARWVTDDDDPVAAEALRTALDLLDADAVHLHSFNGFSIAPLHVLADTDRPVVCSVHDLFLTCPHYSLLYRDEQTCGLPDDPAVCGRCLPETEQRSADALAGRRALVAEHLGTVDHWVLPSQSAADHLLRVYDLDPDRIEVIPHGATVDPPRPDLDLGAIYDEPLRLALVGRGWAKKGIEVANQLADELVDTTVEVHHFGELLVEPSPYLHAHGPYDNELLAELLDQAGIQVALLPGAVPESFGLVMTEVLQAGRPVLGTSFGALGERIRASGAGWTIDPDDPAEVVELVRRLDRSRDELRRATEAARACRFAPVAATAGRYGALYRAGAAADDGRTREARQEAVT